ncbi:N-acetyltransferase [Bacillus sp. Marseille-Q1617]|uniref:GNAT family N-acetyltransferase n=1 Tax=Bacillus sp. Marseille-Q1617 TaxID=2736887 RepID=UPI0015886EB6|nr:GNAT family N-acetyltransferase [Bacillus sp. Marseille-Q1617]
MHLKRESSNKRTEFIPLLLIGDEAEEMVMHYLHEGDIYTIWKEEQRIGIIHVLHSSGNSAEIKNMGLLCTEQGKGFGKEAMKLLEESLSKDGIVTLSVGTANSSIENLAFYQKCGYRINEIKHDFFLQYPRPIVENGIRALDMIVLKKPIG